jgi:16S rRNA (guanine(966)-N(2))-methyltransferase RsmD
MGTVEMRLSNSGDQGRRNYTLAVMMLGLRDYLLPMSKPRNKKSKPGFVRIIGGSWRRRRIAIPAGANQRPTPDRVRETLFNWLSPKLPGAHCLDLYSGTGSLGFEALSRGAAQVV